MVCKHPRLRCARPKCSLTECAKLNIGVAAFDCGHQVSECHPCSLVPSGHTKSREGLLHRCLNFNEISHERSRVSKCGARNSNVRVLADKMRRERAGTYLNVDERAEEQGL